MSGILLPQPRLGRLYAPDDRDHALRAAAPGTRQPRTKYWPMFHRWWDQGATGTCVEHAITHLLLGTPRPLPKKQLPPKFAIYDWAIRDDPWPDNDTDVARQFGTSIRSGMRAAQHYGLIQAYGWAQSMAHVIDYLSWEGGLVLGTVWLPSMFERTREGFVKLNRNQRPVGGHAYYANGYNQRRGAIRCTNSWREWGGFWLAAEDVEYLIYGANGEAASAQERV